MNLKYFLLYLYLKSIFFFKWTQIHEAKTKTSVLNHTFCKLLCLIYIGLKHVIIIIKTNSYNSFWCLVFHLHNSKFFILQEGLGECILAFLSSNRQMLGTDEHDIYTVDPIKVQKRTALVGKEKLSRRIWEIDLLIYSCSCMYI